MRNRRKVRLVLPAIRLSIMLDRTDPFTERAGGINFDHQYGLTLRFGFGSSDDPAGHAIVQELR